MVKEAKSPLLFLQLDLYKYLDISLIYLTQTSLSNFVKIETTAKAIPCKRPVESRRYQYKYMTQMADYVFHSQSLRAATYVNENSYLCQNIEIYTVKPAFKGHQREDVKLAAKGRLFIQGSI